MSALATPFILSTVATNEAVAAEHLLRYINAEVDGGPNTEIWFFYRQNIAPLAKVVWKFPSNSARNAETTKVNNTIADVVA